MPPPTKLLKTDEGVEKRTPDGVIRFEVDNISSLEEADRRCSPEVEARGVHWRGCVWKDEVVHVRDARSLNGLRLQPAGLSLALLCTYEQSTPWEIDVDSVELLLANADTGKNISEERCQSIDNDTEGRAARLLKWEDLIDSKQGFIKDDKITVEIRFWISNMKGIKFLPRFDFTDASDPRHDVSFVIGGEKIYASKAILAAHSRVFDVMFYSPFAEKYKEEIELKEIDRTEFIEMLQVIYPSCKNITFDSAEFLLALGDRFQIGSLVERVENYLTSLGSDNKRFYDQDMLRMADKYRLFGLLDLCLSEQLKTYKDYFKLERSDIFDEISDATKAIILSRRLARLIKIKERTLRLLKTFDSL